MVATTTMEWLPVSVGVLGASLVGSLHCAGMCGGLLVAAIGMEQSRSMRTALVAYHLARGASYALLGALAASFGALVDLAGLLAGVSAAAAWLAGGTLLVILAASLAPARLRSRATSLRPDGISSVLRRVQSRALRIPGWMRGAALGASSACMPCGWLYAFAVVAAGTAEPAAGAAVLLAFWLGTVPILSVLGLGARGVFGGWFGRLPRWTPILMLLLAFGALSGRWGGDADRILRAATESGVDAQGLPDRDTQPACCASRSDEDG